MRSDWQRALLADRFRLAPIVRIEILFAARDGEAFDATAEQLSALRPAPMGHAVVRAAEECMRFLAQRSAGAHRIPIADYLVAAAAQESGAAVLHYDTLAEVLAFESIWLRRPARCPSFTPRRLVAIRDIEPGDLLRSS